MIDPQMHHSMNLTQTGLLPVWMILKLLLSLNYDYIQLSCGKYFSLAYLYAQHGWKVLHVNGR